MARPGESAVTTGFSTTLGTEAVEATIDDAEVLLRKAYGADELEDGTETTMWKYLTRHLIRFEPDRQQESKGLGAAQVTYSGDFGEMLRATSPGQMVMMLDDEDRFHDLTAENSDLFFQSV